MFIPRCNRGLAIGLILFSGWLATGPAEARSQVEIARAVKSKVAPVYPDLARRMSLAGVVKVEITVSPNGSVKTAKLIGGHPVLANAALDAVKKWHFETASGETTGVVQFRFDPGQ